MMIDKDQAPVIKAHILSSYGGTLERTLLTFILKDLMEITASMKLTTSKELNYFQIQALKQEQMQTPQIKRSLMARLNSLRQLRDDVIEEVMKNYGLKLSEDDLNFYHEVMTEHLIKAENQLEEWIKGGAYKSITRRLNQLIAN